jgi:hypothetical protein
MREFVEGEDYIVKTWRTLPMFVCKRCADAGHRSPYSCLNLGMLEEHCNSVHAATATPRALSVPLYNGKGELITEIDETTSGEKSWQSE